ncbi:flagellar motor switch protein FliG [candidate division KSB1 bacterium]|nr:MAG: flagellar motor switch protein FliG [candidate division KSB1 bacterium]
MEISLENLTGRQKAAILIIAIGPESASQIFKNLKDKDIEKLSIEVASMKDIPSTVMEAVVEEFYQMIMAQEYISQGGLEYAKQVLEKALGPRKAHEIVSKVESAIHVSGFKLLKEVDPNQLLNFIQHEHPQTISLILANLEPQQTASILADLPPEIKADVAYRIATMGKISPDLLSDIEGVLENQVESVFGQDLSAAGGAKAVAEILNLSSRSTEKTILADLEKRNPELATEIKNLMFVFEDIVLLDDRSVQRVLREVESKDLSLALKVATDEVKDLIFRNMSERAANIIKEELEFMGPVRLKDVEEAQMKIVEVIRNLEEEGEIVISGRGGEEEIVA